MGYANNPRRFWFSVWGGPKFANGWCFGDTVDQAFGDAALQVIKAHGVAALPVGATITLQRDTTPAEYFDRKVTP